MQCACAPYCHLWPAPLYSIFPHYLTIGTVFGKKKLLNTKCVFWCYLRVLSETFLILRRTARGVIKHVYWSVLSSRCSYQILKKTEYCLQNSEKNYESFSTGSRVFPCGQKNGQTARLI